MSQGKGRTTATQATKDRGNGREGQGKNGGGALWVRLERIITNYCASTGKGLRLFHTGAARIFTFEPLNEKSFSRTPIYLFIPSVIGIFHKKSGDGGKSPAGLHFFCAPALQRRRRTRRALFRPMRNPAYCGIPAVGWVFTSCSFLMNS